MISLFLLVIDQNENYDTRFKARRVQKSSDQIVLITINPSDISKLFDLKTNSLINYSEYQDINDSFFWDQLLWKDLIQKILKADPKSVAITFLFGDNLNTSQLRSNDIMIFKDPRIIWGTNSGEFEKMIIPFATNPDRSNIGHFSILYDDDGISRRVQTNQNKLLNIAQKLAHQKRELNPHPSVINFRGQNVFKKIGFKTILSPNFDLKSLNNKIILIGADKYSNSQVLSPLGPLSRLEYWAHVTDNMIENRFIRPKSIVVNTTLLLFLTIVSVLIIFIYPQTVVLFLFLSIAIIWGAFSIWVFDSYATWVPLSAVLFLLVLVWIIFIGYFVTQVETKNSKLIQDQKYLAELEQLKNNFVSLISHDLKTPISKIQAIVDRQLIEKTALETEDLTNLKNYSDELNRYIQSILKVLRVESKDFKINRQSADINEIIFQVSERLKPIALAKNIKIDLLLEPMFLIEFDAILIGEVLLNLIENAIKFTPQNGLVTIKSFETEHELMIEIADTGEGISTEDQPNIWKKFVRGQNQDLKSKGTGLGLYLVKYFIELHDGEISFQSELGKGTTFFMSLPIETNVENTADEDSSSSSKISMLK
jgi:two-component system, OmpR family, phosphate regulon sensor histidine kinase PhoR